MAHSLALVLTSHLGFLVLLPLKLSFQAIADARVQAERAGAELLHKVALAASKGNKPAQYPNEKVRRLARESDPWRIGRLSEADGIRVPCCWLLIRAPDMM